MRWDIRKRQQAENQLGQPLEKVLPRLYHNLGLEGTAQKLGVPRSTVWHWLVRGGLIPVKRANAALNREGKTLPQ